MNILLIITVGIMNILCLFFGVYIGSKISKDERIEMPKIEPFKAVKEHKLTKAEQREQEKLEKIMQNIENYDGTSAGQQNIP